jgi:probable rRNA maturation factor
MRILNCMEHGLAVVFVNAGTMRHLNSRYRGKDRETDVLSFSYGGAWVDGRPFLGEIVLAPAVAWRQARRWHGRPEREIRKLLIHGILHLMGYDHETDAGEMNRRQLRLMRRAALRRGRMLAEARSEK